MQPKTSNINTMVVAPFRVTLFHLKLTPRFKICILMLSLTFTSWDQNKNACAHVFMSCVVRLEILRCELSSEITKPAY